MEKLCVARTTLFCCIAIARMSVAIVITGEHDKAGLYSREWCKGSGALGWMAEGLQWSTLH